MSTCRNFKVLFQPLKNALMIDATQSTVELLHVVVVLARFLFWVQLLSTTTASLVELPAPQFGIYCAPSFPK